MAWNGEIWVLGSQQYQDKVFVMPVQRVPFELRS